MTNNKTEKEIVNIITGTLKKHQDIHIAGLGTFSVQHQKQVQQQEKNGRIVLAPPSDAITFITDK